LTNTGSLFSWKGLAIGSALLAPFLIYFATAASIVAIWNSSETFAHGYIILPISLWLIWQRRNVLMQMSPQPCWLALIALAGCGFGWLLAELADVQVVRQYMFVVMIPLIIVVVLGWRIAWSMAFPLSFLVLAVPFGDVFLTPLINFTADFTIAAVQMTGIPVLREGTTFALPSGNWSVVEACSGLRYLISSFTLGCLYAYLTYKSPKRRLIFILFSIITPIIANGLRAYMIVMIGHFSGMTLAVGFDHLIYGWVFFGLVMFLMFWVGSFWRESFDDPHKVAVANEQTSASVSSILIATISVIVCISLWPAYSAFISREDANPTVVKIDQFKSDWQEVPEFVNWRPGFLPAFAEVDKSYQNNASFVGMHLGYYRNQNRSSALINSLNQLVKHNVTDWHETGSSLRSENTGAQTITVKETKIRGSGGALLVWQWYWVDGKFMANSYQGKFWQAKQKLLMHGDDGAVLIFYAPYEDNPEKARATMRQFLSTNLAGLESSLAQSKKP
jgi:exosortase A